ncbi:Asp23/Gls24 family envelope stress response protein [Agrilactobacillus fermenti]|uniref:Asp23/Gls24 family envelope stress response protein n=1 Tax=Agrilactobacillus fermenti TaxID=2586909 RepID=UPI001E5797BD|nr:Asp23/Gls24 family envelope stress response protein [Agrilactobacillus fermenti]MCD2255635.1 Asp23/Gls24 family envelope stress response protein [Agrilactobacillus fermenti]
MVDAPVRTNNRSADNKASNDRVNKDLAYDENVIAKITGKTICDIPGVLSVKGNVIENISDRFSNNDDPTKGIKVDLNNDDNTANLEMDTTLEYGKNAPKIFDEATNKIQEAVHSMTGYNVASIKMTVKDMMTKREWEEQNNKNKEDNNNAN